MPNPFGLAPGSTPPGSQAQYLVSFVSVPNPHPAFSSYSGLWEPEYGLVSVHARSNVFQNDVYGGRALEVYERVKRQLASVYGTPETHETMDEDGAFTAPEDFATSLHYDERTHIASWENGHGKKLDAGISKILLAICAEDSSDLYISLAYIFRESRSTIDDLTGVASL